MFNYWSSVMIFHTLLKLQNKSGCKRTEDFFCFIFQRVLRQYVSKYPPVWEKKTKANKHTKNLHALLQLSPRNIEGNTLFKE